MEDLERELLLISKGDELAFNSFMNRYSKKLYYHAFGILSNKEMAEEVVGDVFFEVWKLRKTLLEIASILSWLNTIVYRKSISYLRKEARVIKRYLLRSFKISLFLICKLQWMICFARRTPMLE